MDATASFSSLSLHGFCIHRRDRLARFEVRPHVLQDLPVRPLPRHICQPAHVRLNEDAIVPDEIGAAIAIRSVGGSHHALLRDTVAGMRGV